MQCIGEGHSIRAVSVMIWKLQHAEWINAKNGRLEKEDEFFAKESGT